MKTITRETSSRNHAFTSEIRDAIEAKAQASAELTRASEYLHMLVALAAAGSGSQVAPADAPKERDLTGPELDRAMGWSAAHRRRLGLAASYFAGDGERSPRYHLEDVRRQLTERGPKATAAAAKREPDLEVDDALSRAGLRLVGKGAR